MRLSFIILILGVLFILPFEAIAQEKYWVFFEDKKGVAFNPYEYFDQRTIDRRISQGIPLDQHSDKPVKSDYITQTENHGRVISISRWLNGVVVETGKSGIASIQTFPFVRDVERVVAKKLQLHYDTSLSAENVQLAENQLARFEDSLFQQKEIDGSGVRIAVLDAGFPGVNSSPFFRHLFEKNRIIATYDFVDDEEDVYGHSSHGTMVLSCIAGTDGSKQLGLATGAEFLLARTERALFEPYSEEQNWFEAVEWADKNGADIISSSLGYTYHRYFKQDMNGKTSLVSKAARIAASKGMLLIISMGNEGTDRWKVLSTPADADSIISAGGIHPSTGIHTPFSSYGPTVDLRLKPELTAFGHVIAANQHGLIKVQGTSFSAPLLAGFSACVWQMNPGWDNMELREELKKSGDLYPYHDYAHGYGVPQASYFVNQEQARQVKKLDFKITEDQITIQFLHADGVNPGNYPYLFYHIADEEGVLKRYAVIDPKDKAEYQIKLETQFKDHVLRIHYAGSTQEIIIP